MSARVCLRDCAGARENFLNVKPRVYMSLCPRGSHGLAFSGAQALWGEKCSFARRLGGAGSYCNFFTPRAAVTVHTGLLLV